MPVCSASTSPRRNADQEAAPISPLPAPWSAFRRGLVDALHTGIYEDGTMASAGMGGLDDDWLQRASDMDVYALLELAARPERGASAPAPITDARTALRSLAAVRGRR